MKRVGLLALTLLIALPLRAQPDDDAMANDLAETHRLMGAGRWIDALDHLEALLKSNAGAQYLRSRRVEIVALHRRCAFYAAHKTPQPADVVCGELLSYDARSGKIALRFKPEDLRSKASEKEKTKKDGEAGPERIGEFEKSRTGKYLWFTGFFVSNYTLTVTGSRYPERAVDFFVCLERAGGDAMQVNLAVGPGGGEVLMVRLKGTRGPGQSAKAIPKKRCRPRYSFEIKVGRNDVKVRHDKRAVGQLPKPRELFGGFGLRPFAFDTLTVQGKLPRSWIRSRIDGATARARRIFEKKYDPKKRLPGWLFGKAEEKRERGQFDQRLPGDPSKRDRERLTRALKLIERGRRKRVARLLKEGPKDPVTEGAYRFVEARFLYASGKYARALTVCEGVCARYPNFGPAQLLLGEILRRLGRRTRAIDVLSALASKSVADPAVYEALAMMLLYEGRPGEARDILARGFRTSARTARLEQVYKLIVKANDGPGWSRVFEYKTPNYHILSDMDRKTCLEAGRVLEDGYSGYNMRLKWTRSRWAGLFSPVLKQLLIWNLPDRKQMMRTIRHEGFHQYLDRIMTDPPVWFNEGLAEYFETADFSGGKDPLGLIRGDHLLELDEPVPLKTFLALEPEEFYKRAASSYAQAWALIHFLQHGPAADRKLFKRLFDELQHEEAGTTVVDRVLAQVDMAQFDRDFRAYLDRL